MNRGPARVVNHGLRFRSADAGRRALACIAAAAALVAGCNPAPKGLPALAPVTGVVTRGGAPVTNATVVFTSEQGDQVAFGPTDDAGKYSLTYSGKYKGAALGVNRVEIKSRTDGPQPANWKDPIPAKYNVKTELKAEVKKGPNEIDFKLD